MNLLIRIFKMIIFFVLAPIYVPIYFLMNFTFKWWSGLLDNKD